MSRSHYDVLGIEDDATPEQIKAAYRREAKRLHPDHYAGNDGSAPFRAAREAYEVLCDPQQRCDYDEQLNRDTVERASHTAQPQHHKPQWKPQKQQAPHSRAPVEPLIPGDPVSPLYDDSRQGRYGARVTPPQQRAGTFTVEAHVVLSPTQVRYGGTARLGLPIQMRCPLCGGAGHVMVYRCPQCNGQGVIEDSLLLTLPLPAGLRDGETLRFSLAPAGLPDVDLVLYCTWG